jgi:hypothetical protein
MREIKEKDLFGLILKGLEGENKKVRIVETSGDEYEGIIVGYTRGGYEVQGKVIPAAVKLVNDELSFRIKIDEIDQLFIIEG